MITDESPSQRQICGAKIMYRAEFCQRLALSNGRCPLHGGLSTGIKTAEGRNRQRNSVCKHGYYSAETQQLLKHARDIAKKIAEVLG